jgi:hypothetical protein
MPGHNPTTLELTSCPRERAVSALLALLRGKDYLGELRLVPSEGPKLRSAGGSIRFCKGHDIVVSAEFPPDPSHPRDRGRTCPALEIEGRAYELVYDPIRDRTNPAGKKALIKLCLDVVKAAEPEAFRLRFREPAPAAPLSAEGLVEAIRARKGFPGLVVGFAATSPSWLAVKDFLEWKKMGGYQVLDLL